MKGAPPETDFVVVGAGVAGLRAAIELADAGRVVVLAKREVTDSPTQWAQGGIAAALSDEDEIGLHLQDTLNAGDGLCDPQAAAVLVEDAPDRIEELIQWGTQFDREGTKLTFGREGAHSRNRILHAHGDSTGREILRALYAKAKTLTSISVCEFEFSTDLDLHQGRVCGIHLIGSSGEKQYMTASAVMLASGAWASSIATPPILPWPLRMASPWPTAPEPKSATWSLSSSIPRRSISSTRRAS
jgi:L-aspartate oxidase